MRLPFIAFALIGTVSSVVVSGCALDSSDQELSSTAPGEALESEGTNAARWAASVETKSNANLADDGTALAANCSIVQWCNRPNSPEGTVCLAQRGCTQQQAADECFSESFTVCGTPLCPWILVTVDGRRLNFAGCP
jgi:hypothetical protein